MSYTARESWRPRFQIGLDGVPRRSETSIAPYLATGRWVGDDTLVVEVEIVGYTTFDRWEYRFTGGGLEVTESSITGVYTYRGTPRVVEKR